MKPHYDFSNARRGPVIPPTARTTAVTLHLDTEALDWFRDQVNRAGGGDYQTLINHALREYIALRREPLEDLLRRVVREKLHRAA